MSDDQLTQAFKRFDADGNGKIDRTEFASLIRELGTELTDDEVMTAFNAIDGNGNGEIELGEFSAWWKVQR